MGNLHVRCGAGENSEITSKSYLSLLKLFNQFAGFTLGEADIIRRAMSKKHLDELVVYKDKFINGLCERGANRDKVEKFWDELIKFSEYAFNKSHSCAYSHVAYYTAWLKYYYPREYLAAVINTTVFDKIGGIVAECRQEKIKVCPVNVNKSEEDFAVFGDAIVYGMRLVKEVGGSAKMIIAERRKNGPFKSLIDFVVRTRADKTVVENLIKAGAFDEFCNNRTAMLDVLPLYLDLLKKLKTQEKKLEDETLPEAKKEKVREKIDEILEDMLALEISSSSSENLDERLEVEKALTGCYLSAHPLDFYDLDSEKATNISDLKSSRSETVIGAISNLKITNRKSDGKEMAFFTIEDRTGIVDVCCFTDCYSRFSDLIREGNVIKVTGSVNEEKRGEDETEETILKVNVKTITSVKKKTERICIQVSSVVDWVEYARNIALKYRDTNGFELIIFDKSRSEFRRTTLYVSKDVLNDRGISGFISVCIFCFLFMHLVISITLVRFSNL